MEECTLRTTNDFVGRKLKDIDHARYKIHPRMDKMYYYLSKWLIRMKVSVDVNDYYGDATVRDTWRFCWEGIGEKFHLMSW